MATKPIFDDVAEWPKAAQAPAPKDHNKPPLEEIIPAEFREAILEERPDFYQKLDDLLGKGDPNSEDWSDGAVHRAKCDDEKTAALCSSLVGILRAAERHIEGVHKAVKQPYLDGGRLVDGQKNTLVARIATGRSLVENIQADYAEKLRLAERKRLQDEAAQRQKEADDRAALEALAAEKGLEAALPPPPEPVFSAPAPKAAPIRSDDGASVSFGVDYVATVSNYPKAFKLVQHDAKVKEAIDAAIKRYAKSIKATDKSELPGVSIAEVAKVNNR